MAGMRVEGPSTPPPFRPRSPVGCERARPATRCPRRPELCGVRGVSGRLALRLYWEEPGGDAGRPASAF